MSQQIELFKKILLSFDKLVFPDEPIGIIDIKSGQENKAISEDGIACYFPIGSKISGGESYGVVVDKWNNYTLQDVGHCIYCQFKSGPDCHTWGPIAGAIRLAAHEVRHRLQFNYLALQKFGKGTVANLAMANSYRSALVCFPAHKQYDTMKGLARVLEIDALTIEFLMLKKIRYGDQFAQTVKEIIMMQPNGRPFSTS